MKKPSFFILKLSFLIGFILIISSCIKNDNLIAGDAKIKFFNFVNTGAAKDFYLDSAKYVTGASYGNSAGYTIVPVSTFPGGQSYRFMVKNTLKPDSLKGTLKYLIEVGKNYSVYYTKNKKLDSMLVIYEDNLTIDPDKAKLIFLNLGYNLSNKVYIRDEKKSYEVNLNYNEKTDYKLIDIDPKLAKIYMNNVDSVNVIDTISGTNFSKGKIYTILIDSDKAGRLLKRVLANN
ncbi:DUF4397 domain-containing protein [Pedobacter punctiformis]|uniref:DUF4397 domain-containing protein n=1 Tax=Pedobacter punctiformis TaxID=3004097 RepID=A0ABT4L9A2_9SPHI|nr:DUF4397 domain-containing protein [Pedobacter sp. HCMS5-2]MCZ4244489.1 hypothetical protein [Pedobacter sp. HCMS5-2]